MLQEEIQPLKQILKKAKIKGFIYKRKINPAPNDVCGYGVAICNKPNVSIEEINKLLGDKADDYALSNDDQARVVTYGDKAKYNVNLLLF